MPKAEYEIYKKIGINNLILFAIYAFDGKKIECTFENLVKKCFEMFPGAFSFDSIKKWPDSRKLDRPLRELRDKKLIEGSPKKSFSLTKQGKISIEGIAKNFGQRRLQI